MLNALRQGGTGYLAILSASITPAILVLAAGSLVSSTLPWLSLALVVSGAIFLFIGTAGLVIETNMSTGILQSEIETALAGTPDA